MGQIDAFAVVEARVAGALVDVDFTPRAREAGRAEALWAVVDGDAEASVFAGALGAKHVLALVLGRGARAERLLSRVALEALALARERLEKVDGAGRARGEAGVGVGT